MTQTRGAANQSLYLARILLAGWDAQREGGRFPEAQLAAAYLPAVRRHLCDAYGWFLLSVAGTPEAEADALPRSTGDLAPAEPGREWPPELREFALLERADWLAELLGAEDPVTVAPGRAQNVLGSDRGPPGHAVAARWVRELEGTMQRMDDFLAES